MKQILTAKEEELMNVFWQKGEMCIRDLVNSLPEPKPSYTTVSTQVSFLENKGFLKRRPIANTFIYEVNISEKEYRGSTVSNIVERYYNNSFASVVSQFLEDEKLGIDELKEIIAQIENSK
ncbi:MAG: BlaI/MecI/CopY family transcriptional regulator [Bacteroidales bacterium]|nr:BlaI/MecI/CopY family transcriptional regulator [Bacteroidales bacterium]